MRVQLSIKLLTEQSISVLLYCVSCMHVCPCQYTGNRVDKMRLILDMCSINCQYNRITIKNVCYFCWHCVGFTWFARLSILIPARANINRNLWFTHKRPLWEYHLFISKYVVMYSTWVNSYIFVLGQKLILSPLWVFQTRGGPSWDFIGYCFWQ